MTPHTKTHLRLTFRTAAVKHILQAVNAGDSCSIVGIGSVGKSNLLRFLLDEAVHRHHLAKALADCLFIYVDLNKILKKCWLIALK